jgi:hypothetical protein
MKTAIKSSGMQSDAAAVFAVALSLWEACQKEATGNPKLNFSETYSGMDQFMRELMRVANQFEAWACQYIDFAQSDQPWPYLLQDHFGEACLQVVSPDNLAAFDADACLCVAILLRLPVKPDKGLPVPVNLKETNPLYAKGSSFREFRIQSVRDGIDDHCVPYTHADDPFDGSFSAPYFGLYGVDAKGHLEHIADRPTCAKTLGLAQNLVPGIYFEHV